MTAFPHEKVPTPFSPVTVTQRSALLAVEGTACTIALDGRLGNAVV